MSTRSSVSDLLPIEATALTVGKLPDGLVNRSPGCSVSPVPSAELLSYPRPTKGILVAMIVMNCTFVSSGRLAIYKTDSAT